MIMPSFRLESLCEIKLQALRIEPYLEGRDAKGIEQAKATYEDLVDRFYQAEENLAPHQYRAAKKDFEYFMRLLDLATAFYRDGGKRATADKAQTADNANGTDFQ